MTHVLVGALLLLASAYAAGCGLFVLTLVAPVWAGRFLSGARARPTAAVPIAPDTYDNVQQPAAEQRRAVRRGGPQARDGARVRHTGASLAVEGTDPGPAPVDILGPARRATPPTPRRDGRPIRTTVDELARVAGITRTLAQARLDRCLLTGEATTAGGEYLVDADVWAVVSRPRVSA